MNKELTSIEEKVYNNVKNLINANNRKGKETIIAEKFLTILAKGNKVTEEQFKNALVRLSELGLIIPEKPGKILTLYTLPTESETKSEPVETKLEPVVEPVNKVVDEETIQKLIEEYEPNINYEEIYSEFPWLFPNFERLTKLYNTLRYNYTKYWLNKDGEYHSFYEMLKTALKYYLKKETKTFEWYSKYIKTMEQCECTKEDFMRTVTWFYDTISPEEAHVKLMQMPKYEDGWEGLLGDEFRELKDAYMREHQDNDERIFNVTDNLLEKQEEEAINPKFEKINTYLLVDEDMTIIQYFNQYSSIKELGYSQLEKIADKVHLSPQDVLDCFNYVKRKAEVSNK